jgi:hypothetical protein
MNKPTLRKESSYAALTEEQFRGRFFSRFHDPAFEKVKGELERVFQVAWEGYIQYRRSPRLERAGDGFASASSGSTGSTTAGCSARSVTCLQPSTKRSTIAVRTLQRRRPDSTNELSGEAGGGSTGGG